MIIKFKEFISNFQDYYQTKEVVVFSESDMQEICYDLYDTDNFEIDYENKTIELFY